MSTQFQHTSVHLHWDTHGLSKEWPQNVNIHLNYLHWDTHSMGLCMFQWIKFDSTLCLPLKFNYYAYNTVHTICACSYKHYNAHMYELWKFCNGCNSLNTVHTISTSISVGRLGYSWSRTWCQ